MEWVLWEVSQAQCKCQGPPAVLVVQEQVDLEELEEPEEQEQRVWEEQEAWEACHQEWE